MASGESAVTDYVTGLATAERAAVEEALDTARARRLRAFTILGSAFVVAVLIAMPRSPIGQNFRNPVAATETDFGIHANVAREMAEDGFTPPHFLWHLVVVALHAVAPSMSWMQTAFIVVVASYALQGALLAWILTTVAAEPRRAIHAIGIVLVTVLLVTAAPVTVLTWREQELYFGYLNMESYRSPTHALLKPLALIVFALTAKLFANAGTRREQVVLATTVILSSVAKPSLTICLVPASVVLGAWSWLKGRPLQLKYLIAAVLVPSAAVLVLQYVYYFGPEGRSAIVFAPFAVMAHYATGLFPKFLLSILLPLTVLVLYRRQVLTDSAMQLAWLQFAFAAGYTYLLAETRESMAGNFAWSGQIGTYLLFVASTVFAMRQWTGQWRSVLCGVAGGMHAISGILFFVTW